MRVRKPDKVGGQGTVGVVFQGMQRFSDGSTENRCGTDKLQPRGIDATVSAIRFQRQSAPQAMSGIDPRDCGRTGIADALAYFFTGNAEGRKNEIQQEGIQRAGLMFDCLKGADHGRVCHYPPPKNICPTGDVKRINPAGPSRTIKIEGKIRNTRGIIIFTGA